jgi:hypothetical protein
MGQEGLGRLRAVSSRDRRWGMCSETDPLAAWQESGSSDSGSDDEDDAVLVDRPSLLEASEGLAWRNEH